MSTTFTKRKKEPKKEKSTATASVTFSNELTREGTRRPPSAPLGTASFQTQDFPPSGHKQSAPVKDFSPQPIPLPVEGDLAQFPQAFQARVQDIFLRVGGGDPGIPDLVQEPDSPGGLSHAEDEEIDIAGRQVHKQGVSQGQDI